MKIATLFLWICLFAIQVFAEKNNGQIEQLRPGFYQISYPGQTINIIFSYSSTNGLDRYFLEPELPDIEKYEIVNILKEQIDLLPKSVVDDFLNVDLLPLSIQNRFEFGYTFENKLVVEISKIKDGMSYVNSVQSALVHEIGHLIEENPAYRNAVADIKNYLHAVHQTYDSPGKSSEESIFQKGYVSTYASGELANHYEASEEFTEIFAHLVCKDSRSELLNYVENNPGTILSIKIDHFIDFLDSNIPALGYEYIFNEFEYPEHSQETFRVLNGEELLAAHERRSYESINFKSMEDHDEQLLARQEENMDSNTEPFNDWDKVQQDMEYTYEYDDPSESYTQREPTPFTPKQKKKKKKKRNGSGLLITGAALYVLLQLLK